VKANGRGPCKFRCPTCGKPADYDGRFFPFCSERCKLVDLGRWFNEEYSIPAEEESADENPADS
jgi:uncharacterized protein